MFANFAFFGEKGGGRTVPHILHFDMVFFGFFIFLNLFLVFRFLMLCFFVGLVIPDRPRSSQIVLRGASGPISHGAAPALVRKAMWTSCWYVWSISTSLVRFRVGPSVSSPVCVGHSGPGRERVERARARETLVHARALHWWSVRCLCRTRSVHNRPAGVA